MIVIQWAILRFIVAKLLVKTIVMMMLVVSDQSISRQRLPVSRQAIVSANYSS